MNHDVAWAILVAAGLGGAYFWNKRKNESAKQITADLRRRRAEFFEAQKQRWALFYRMHKRQFGLTDEEIISRYIFVTMGEISSAPRLNGWAFPTTAPSRDEILEFISNDHLIPRNVLEAIAARFDRDGEIAFASKYEVMLEVMNSCHDEDEEEARKQPS